MNLIWSLLLPLALVTHLVASPDSEWASQSNDELHDVEKYASATTTLEPASYPQSDSPHTVSPPSVLTYSDGAESQPTQSSEASTITTVHSSNQESTAVPVPPTQSAFSSEIISSVISVHDASEQTATGTDQSIDNRPSISAPANTNDSPASSGGTQDPGTLSAPASARSMTTLSTDHSDTGTESLTAGVTENPEHSLTSQDTVAFQSVNGTSSIEAESELSLSATSTDIESVSSFTSTITSDSVISVTVVLTTFKTVVSQSNGTALGPLTTTASESPDSMTDSLATLTSGQKTLSSKTATTIVKPTPEENETQNGNWNVVWHRLLYPHGIINEFRIMLNYLLLVYALLSDKYGYNLNIWRSMYSDSLYFSGFFCSEHISYPISGPDDDFNPGPFHDFDNKALDDTFHHAPISLTEPAKANQYDCATPVKGAATSTVAHNWDAGLPFQPFRDPKALIAEFCNMLETFELVIVPREPGQDKESQGECHNFYVEPTAEALALYNYRVTVGVVFDYNGCKGPDDKHKEGIDFSKYGSKKCRDNFKDLLVDKCKFSDHFVKDGTNMGPNKWIGGMAWKDCMRWTVIAPDEKFAAPDTLPGLKVPE
ncbi:hypothetical protein B0A52_09419 [Exophiala mesophila]|uniref:Uncharacterized protein n=1 Tax=Exophiala mesophila TaxID=212818 RepID=A0A438MTK7_EXOME|nr:hypothetical protein B0A52_09419 [Exophiala mesophila]